MLQVFGYDWPLHCSEDQAQQKSPRRMILTLLPQKSRTSGAGSRCLGQEATMTTTGAVFQPELIQLMKTVLDDATATLPEAKRTSTMKAEIASQILACAARGERDPIALRNSALLAVVECTHYSHDISPERRAV
jgi:hypothetical protein